jgi:hypothetical protein
MQDLVLAAITSQYGEAVHDAHNARRQETLRARPEKLLVVLTEIRLFFS